MLPGGHRTWTEKIKERATGSVALKKSHELNCKEKWNGNQRQTVILLLFREHDKARLSPGVPVIAAVGKEEFLVAADTEFLRLDLFGG